MRNKMFFLAVLFLLPQSLVFAGGKEETGDSGVSAVPVEVTLTYLEGTVTVDGGEARFGQTVPTGALVQTAVDSLCELQFGGGNIIHVEEETLVRIDIGKEFQKLDLQRGGVQAVFDRLTGISGGDGFLLSSPTATAGIRGTVFYMRVEDASSTYLCTCFGTIEQGPRDGSAPVPVTANHHKAYRFIRSGDGYRTESAGLMYHDDAAMEALARTIGTEIRWGEGGY